MKLFLIAVFLGDLGHGAQTGGNVFVAVLAVGLGAGGAVLDALIRIGEITAAFCAKRIQRAIAEQAIEMLRICAFVAGKILAFFIFDKFIVLHKLPSFAFCVILLPRDMLQAARG